MLGFCFMLTDEKNYANASLDGFCFARQFMFFAGFPLFSGPIFSKVYRVHKIFNSRRYSRVKKPLTDSQIMKIVAIYTALNICFVVIYQLIYPWKRVLKYEPLIRLDVV